MNIFGDSETFLSIVANCEDSGEVGEEFAGGRTANGAQSLFGDPDSFQYINAEQAFEVQSAPQYAGTKGGAVQEILQTIDELTNIDCDTNESELQLGNLEFVEAVYYDSDIDSVFENLNQAFACIAAADCGKIRVGNDYGAFEIDRKCGAPYARFCPCPPDKKSKGECDSKPQCNNSDKISAGLTDLTDLFSWYLTARENGNCNKNGKPCDNFGNCNGGGYCPSSNCHNNMNGEHCPNGNLIDNSCDRHDNFMRCDNPAKWTPQNNCCHPQKPPLRPCAKRLSRNIYYKLLQTTQAVSFLIDCAPNAQSKQTLCCVKQNLDTLSIAMLATSKQICGARPISMNAFDNFNCPFEKGVYAVICELSATMKDIQLLQTLPAAQPVYGALAIISFGINRVISMLYTL